ncbi:MAG: helix-turn-helix domain-containing protein [Defluviitaleaceae bacterium]|nr:helix-turn-helix domain-containing protein [Defluviitaleaceae bacterium]
MNTGELIRRARKSAKITQQALADRLSVNYTLISQYERGIRKPKIDTLLRIATALDVGVTALLGDDIPIVAGDIPEGATITVEHKVIDLEGNALHTVINDKGLYEIIEDYLNDDGKQRVVDFVRDLIRIEDYCKKTVPCTSEVYGDKKRG